MKTVKIILIMSILLTSFWVNAILPTYLYLKSGKSKKHLLLYLIAIPDIIVLYYSIQFLIDNT